MPEPGAALLAVPARVLAATPGQDMVPAMSGPAATGARAGVATAGGASAGSPGHTVPAFADRAGP